MKHLNISMILASSFVLTVLMAVAGCGHHDGGDRDRHHYETQNIERHEDRHDSDRHDYRGGNPGHEQAEHGDR